MHTQHTQKKIRTYSMAAWKKETQNATGQTLTHTVARSVILLRVVPLLSNVHMRRLSAAAHAHCDGLGWGEAVARRVDACALAGGRCVRAAGRGSSPQSRRSEPKVNMGEWREVLEFV